MNKPLNLTPEHLENLRHYLSQEAVLTTQAAETYEQGVDRSLRDTPREELEYMYDQLSIARETALTRLRAQEYLVWSLKRIFRVYHSEITRRAKAESHHAKKRKP